jgi:hypothetical protein
MLGKTIVTYLTMLMLTLNASYCVSNDSEHPMLGFSYYQLLLAREVCVLLAFFMSGIRLDGTSYSSNFALLCLSAIGLC